MALDAIGIGITLALTHSGYGRYWASKTGLIEVHLSDQAVKSQGGCQVLSWGLSSLVFCIFVEL